MYVYPNKQIHGIPVLLLDALMLLQLGQSSSRIQCLSVLCFNFKISLKSSFHFNVLEIGLLKISPKIKEKR